MNYECETVPVARARVRAPPVFQPTGAAAREEADRRRKNAKRVMQANHPAAMLEGLAAAPVEAAQEHFVQWCTERLRTRAQVTAVVEAVVLDAYQASWRALSRPAQTYVDWKRFEMAKWVMAVMHAVVACGLVYFAALQSLPPFMALAGLWSAWICFVEWTRNRVTIEALLVNMVMVSSVLCAFSVHRHNHPDEVFTHWFAGFLGSGFQLGVGLLQCGNALHEVGAWKAVKTLIPNATTPSVWLVWLFVIVLGDNMIHDLVRGPKPWPILVAACGLGALCASYRAPGQSWSEWVQLVLSRLPFLVLMFHQFLPGMAKEFATLTGTEPITQGTHGAPGSMDPNANVKDVLQTHGVTSWITWITWGAWGAWGA